MKFRSVVSELIQALRGIDGQTGVIKLIRVFLIIRTRLKLNMWNVNLPFFFYGSETWTKLELLLLASRERYLGGK
jgi:hypothetical protein